MTSRLTMVPIAALAAALVFSSALLLAPQKANADITSGLVGHWRFDAGSGTSARDSSGNGNHGTLTNDVTWVAGRIGAGALDFGGENDYVTMPTFNETLLPATFSAWVKIPTANLEACGGLIFSRDGANVSGINVESCQSPGDVGYHWDNDKYVWANGPAIPDDKWALVVLVVESDEARMYVYSVDGQFSATNTDTHASSAFVNLKIGIDDYEIGGRAINALVDDVRVYDRALSESDVAELYAYTGVALSRPPNNLGLVGYWPMDEGTGTVAGDHSGNSRTGTLTGSTGGLPTWVAGKRGKAVKFDGVDDYVNAGRFIPLEAASAFTFATWVKADAFQTDENFTGLIDYGKNNESNFFLHLRGNGGFNRQIGFEIRGTAGYTVVESPGVLELNTWYHIVAIADGTNVLLYLNGQLVDSDVRDIMTADSSLYVAIGRSTYNGAEGRFLIGSMDDTRIYNRALGATEIAALARGGAARIGASSVDLARGSSLESGLVGHWTFDGGDTNWTSASAGTTLDRSGNGNTGTLTNMNQQMSITRGVLGQGLVFDGSDDYVQLPDLDGVGGVNAPLSISGWFKQSNLNDNQTIIDIKTPAADRYQLGTRSSDFGPWKDGGEFWVSTAAPSVNEWHHFTSIYDGTTHYIYMDGSLASSTTSGLNTSGAGDVNPPRIGSLSDSAGEHYSGMLDDVRIYNRALTAAEVKQLYNLGKVRITQ